MKGVFTILNYYFSPGRWAAQWPLTTAPAAVGDRNLHESQQTHGKPICVHQHKDFGAYKLLIKQFISKLTLYLPRGYQWPLSTAKVCVLNKRKTSEKMITIYSRGLLGGQAYVASFLSLALLDQTQPFYLHLSQMNFHIYHVFLTCY